ncbi:hypothetical protein ACWY4P_17305 [Streptomyces sp. LZ34]
MKARRPARPRRTFMRAGAAVLGTVAMSGVFLASPARADDEPVSGTPCTPGSYYLYVQAAEVNPVLTHFYSFNVTDGTTGERTYTLSKVNTVTTSVGTSTEISVSGEALFAKVAVKVGFSVQTTTSTTDTESTTMKWNFTKPGYYGMYKGTRAVSGTFRQWSCLRNFGSPTGGSWGNRAGTQPYTTFANVEEGTIRCDDQVPPGTLRERARLQLGC